ncbi:CDP-glucose 4,6-dehydratase [Bacillus haimaensis]|uniref:CDP-glucose 4,6-dehydratase n=1 Tax=Bacillus haimaensis TaxID=3160967 RepID=UPI003AA92ADE
MEKVVNEKFWEGKKVFVTGHTGFKGSWLSLWLHSLGAHVTGYALAPPTNPSLYDLCGLSHSIDSIFGDIRDQGKLQKAIKKADPDIVFHLAAQPIVQQSYQEPVSTYEINVMGTIYLLDSIKILARNGSKKRAIINVTSDKCYLNQEWYWGYRETDQLGGFDPYSNSKACSELVTSSYRNSFFNSKTFSTHGVGIATARAGNVIGGGDWAKDRLVPDCIKALLKGEEVKVRNPLAVRPWQHVLEPLNGYMILGEKLYLNGQIYGDAWNFGPCEENSKSVEWVVKNLIAKWDRHASYEIEQGSYSHETKILRLDSSKAIQGLGWRPRWNIDEAITRIIEWTLAYREGKDLNAICLEQINEYISK